MRRNAARIAYSSTSVLPFRSRGRAALFYTAVTSLQRAFARNHASESEVLSYTLAKLSLRDRAVLSGSGATGEFKKYGARETGSEATLVKGAFWRFLQNLSIERTCCSGVLRLL